MDDGVLVHYFFFGVAPDDQKKVNGRVAGNPGAIVKPFDFSASCEQNPVMLGGV